MGRARSQSAWHSAQAGDGQQLLTEGFWIAIAGTAGGLLLMYLLTGMLGRLSLPLPLPLDLRTRMDGRVLAYTVVLTMATTVLCALAPALQTTRGSQWSLLRQGDGRSKRRLSLRNVLVVSAGGGPRAAGDGVAVRAQPRAGASSRPGLRHRAHAGAAV